MTDQHLSVPDGRLAYDVTDAPAGSTRATLVVAHGLSSSRATEDAEGVFDRSALVGRRVVRYDARGHGSSGGTPDPARFAWPRLAEDLLTLIDHVSPHEPVDALGASMGTGTILWAALRRPERFRRLVLTIPPTAWSTRVPQVDGYLAGADLVEAEGLAGWERVAQTLQAPQILSDGGWAFSALPAISEQLLPSVLRGAAASDLPDLATLATLPLDVLLLPWETDPVHPVVTAQTLAETLPHATLEVATTPDAIRGWAARAVAFLDA